MADKSTNTKKSQATEKQQRKAAVQEKEVWTSKIPEEETKEEEPVKVESDSVWAMGTITLGIAILVMVSIALWYEIHLSAAVSTVIGLVVSGMFIYYEYRKSGKEETSVEMLTEV